MNNCNKQCYNLDVAIKKCNNYSYCPCTRRWCLLGIWYKSYIRFCGERQIAVSRHTVHSLCVTWNINIFSLRAMLKQSVAPNNSSPVVPTIASSPTPKLNSLPPKGIILWSVVCTRNLNVYQFSEWHNTMTKGVFYHTF
jgi:hypothetical protein